MRNYLIGIVLDALKSLLESEKIREYIEQLKDFIAEWVEAKLRSVVADSENTFDDELLQLILDALKK